MSKKEDISHPGIIEQVVDDKVFVKILSMSACSSCHAKNMCNVAEVEEKVVEVRRDPRRTLKVGEQVTLTMRKSLGTLAVMLGYVVPFLLLMAVLILVLLITDNEGAAGLAGILILIPYYWLLYIFRDKLKSTFSFMIE